MTKSKHRGQICLVSFSFFWAALSLFAVSGAAPAQTVSYTGGTYSENFDGLGTLGNVQGDTFVNGSTLTGFYVYRALTGPGGAMSSGTGAGATTEIIASTGSGDGAGAIYNAGAFDASDRALGLLRSGTSGNLFMGVRITNNGPGALTSFTLSVTGEQYRAGVANRPVPERLDFQYSTASTATINDPLTGSTFTDANNLDIVFPGASATGQVNPAVSVPVSGTVTLTVPLAAGGTLYLRWADFDPSGADDLTAIDNLVFSGNFAALVPDPPSGCLFLGGILLITTRLCRYRSRATAAR